MPNTKLVNSKSEFLSLRKNAFVEVNIEGLKNKLRLRKLDGHDRQAFLYESEKDNPNPIESQVILVSRSVVDENGSRIFAETDRDDVLSLPGTVLDEITVAVMELNKMAPAAVEAAVRDFAEAQSDSSGSN